MKKYGINHFHIELIEETDKPEEREIYWIETLKTYKNGYNATLGGDGKKYIDYDLVIATYNKIQDVPKTAIICKISRDSVKNILNQNNIEFSHNSNLRNQKEYGKVVFMLDKTTNEILKVFPSACEAAREIIKQGKSKDTIIHIGSSIGKVCNGKRKTAYTYKWQWG